MKNTFSHPFLSVILILLFTGLFYACGSTSTTSATPDKDMDLGYNNLLDMLRRQPGLTISGNGPNASVTIRGFRSVEGTNEPLFIIDGAPLGFGYGAASSVDVTTVESIKVLSPAQSGLYGSRGGNGVVQISTKK